LIPAVFVGWGVIAFGTSRLSKRRTALDAIEHRRKACEKERMNYTFAE
jgi:hypothetical protein